MTQRAKPTRPVFNPGHPLADGLTLAWLMDNAGEDHLDDRTVSGFDSVAFGATTGPQWLNTRFGSATRLETLDYMRGPDEAQATDDFTVSFLLVPLYEFTESGTTVGGQFTLTGDSNDVDWSVFYYSGLNRINLRVTTTSGARVAYGSFYPVEGEIYNLTFTKEGTKAYVYVNGDLVGSHASLPTDTLTTDYPITLGSTVSWATHKSAADYHGFMMWNRALSDAEVAQLNYDFFAAFRPSKRYLGIFPPPKTDVVRNAVSAGYPLAAGHTGDVSEKIDADELARALAAGWTLGEAVGVAMPQINSTLRVIGDPLATLRFPLNGYNIYRRDSRIGPDTLIGATPPGATSHVLKNQSGSTLVHVKAVNKLGKEDVEPASGKLRQMTFEGGEFVTPTPNKPTDLRLDLKAGGMLAVSFTYNDNREETTPIGHDILKTINGVSSGADSVAHEVGRGRFSKTIGPFNDGDVVQVQIISYGEDDDGAVGRSQEITIDATAPDQPVITKTEVE